VRRLRPAFERLGRRLVEQPANVRGRRLDVARVRALAAGALHPGLLVHSTLDEGADAYIGLLIDRSGSMEGAKLELAKRFAALLVEAARGIPGLSGHVSAFDDDTFYRLGDLRRHTIPALTSGGGNNDAGGLEKAAELALASGKRRRLLVIISDGSPTGCSVDALARFIGVLTRQWGIQCVQVAVDAVEHDVFPSKLDLAGLAPTDAVARFARLLRDVAGRWA
jgi:nitric oxide reductase activation protein